MRGAVLIAALLVPAGPAAKGETFADVAGLVMQHAEADCGGLIAAQAADSGPGTTSFAAVVAELQAIGAGQSWPEAWPPTDATLKALSILALAGTGWGRDLGGLRDLVQRPGQEATPEAATAARRLATSGELHACLTPTEAELASVPEFVGSQLRGEDVEALGCLARYAPLFDEVVQVGRPPDNVRTDLRAIDAEMIACQRDS